MSNFDVIDALRALPPRTPGRQVRLLVALATFPVDGDDWRAVPMPLLAYRAGMSQKRCQQTRRELEAAGLLDYSPPGGRGQPGHVHLILPKVERNVAPPFKGERNVAPPSRQKVERLSIEGGASLAQKVERNVAPLLSSMSAKDVFRAGAREAGPSPNGAGPARSRNADPVPLGDALAIPTSGPQKKGRAPMFERPEREAVPRCTFRAGSLECAKGDRCPNVASHPGKRAAPVLPALTSVLDAMAEQCPHGTPAGGQLNRAGVPRCPLCRLGAADPFEPAGQATG